MQLKKNLLQDIAASTCLSNGTTTTTNTTTTNHNNACSDLKVLQGGGDLNWTAQ